MTDFELDFKTIKNDISITNERIDYITNFNKHNYTKPVPVEKSHIYQQLESNNNIGELNSSTLEERFSSKYYLQK